MRVNFFNYYFFTGWLTILIHLADTQGDIGKELFYLNVIRVL